MDGATTRGATIWPVLFTLGFAFLLVVLPIVLGVFFTPRSVVNDVVVGVLVGIFAVVRLRTSMAWPSWVTLILGLYLVGLAIADHGFRAPVIVEGLGGTAIAFLSCWSLFQPFAEPPQGGPLFQAHLPQRHE